MKTEQLLNKHGLEQYQEILKRVDRYNIIGNLTKHEKNVIKVIIDESIDVLLTHFTSGRFEQNHSNTFQKDIDKIETFEIIGQIKKDEDEYEIVKSLIQDSLKFWCGCTLRSELISFIENNGQYTKEIIEYCSECQMRPCYCEEEKTTNDFINDYNESLIKTNNKSKNYSDFTYYDEDAHYCEACENRPCICSDPERTSTTYNG